MGYGFGNRIAVGRRAITASAQAEQIIWKVAIFGAGTTSSNGEYVWDGETLENGNPIYISQTNPNSLISFGDFNNGGLQWGIYDDSAGFATYVKALGDSLNNSWILNTQPDPTASLPVPSSAFSYAQDSFISSLTLTGGNTCNGTYTRASGGETTFYGPAGSDGLFEIVYNNPEVDQYYWVTLNGDNGSLDYITDIEPSPSQLNLFKWNANDGIEPVPTVSAVVYSA